MKIKARCFRRCKFGSYIYLLAATETFTMNFNRHYKQAVIYPFIVAMLLTTVFSIIENRNYKSEWFTASAVIEISIIWVLFYSLFICGLSLTILLNKFEKIRTNKLLVILNWFLLPCSFIAVVLSHEISYTIRYDAGKFGSSFVQILILNLPFVIGLILSYICYRKTTNR